MAWTSTIPARSERGGNGGRLGGGNAGGGLSHTEVMENTNGSTSLTLKVDRDVAGSEALLAFYADSDTSSTNLYDRIFEIHTDSGVGDVLTFDSYFNSVRSTAMRIYNGGAVTFGNLNNSAPAAFQVAGSCWLRSTCKITGVLEVGSVPDVAAKITAISPAATVFETANNNSTQLASGQHHITVFWGQESSSNASGSFVLPASPPDPCVVSFTGSCAAGLKDIAITCSSGQQVHAASDNSGLAGGGYRPNWTSYYLKNVGGRCAHARWMPSISKWLFTH